MARLKELLKLAEQQIGYQEKASAAMLDDPHGNAGYNNYTKYARDVNNWGLDGCQGQPWCATYQFWLEARIFGVETALKHFCMSRNSYRAYNCFEIYDAFERKGKISRSPGIGSLIVFRHSHIGRVIDVRNGYVYTNEGNTSALYGDSKRIEMGNRIRTLRKRRVGSQSEFAEKLDVSVVTISRIENGMTKIDAELLIKMSEVLQVPVNIILGMGQQEYFV